MSDIWVPQIHSLGMRDGRGREVGLRLDLAHPQGSEARWRVWSQTLRRAPGSTAWTFYQASDPIRFFETGEEAQDYIRRRVEEGRARARRNHKFEPLS